MKTEIESVLPSGYGYWVVKCFKFNWSRKKPISITSTTTWKVTTNNSTLIDDYKMGIKRAEIALIRYCKEYGSKKIEKH